MKKESRKLTETERLQLVAEAVKYCTHVSKMGMPVAAYSKALREALYHVCTKRLGSKANSAKYRSKDAMGKTWGRREICLDHAIPYRYELEALMKLTEPTPENVRDVLNKYYAHVIITSEEDARLTSARLQSRMPDDWNQVDELARYRAVGIEVHPNPNRPAKPPDRVRP